MIVGNNDKSIQRTLDFVVKESAQANVSLTVLNPTSVVDGGENIRQLLPGVKVTALYKAPFYRVKLEDGKEGWVEASAVKDPTDELYLMGFRAFQNDEYTDAASYFRQALQFDPKHMQSHFYLAKIYLKQGEDNLAANELKETLAMDPQNSSALAMADTLAHKYLDAKDYSQVFELEPELLLGRLNGTAAEKVVAQVRVNRRAERRIASVPAVPKEIAVSRDIITNSIGLVKDSRTGKGSSIASAIGSVLSMTKSLGTRVVDDGWKVVAASDGPRVIYAVRQEKKGKLENEDFEWKVDQDRHSAVPLNENARLLMNRW